jgi:hypothetical protein
MAWRILAWAKQELIELLSEGLELVADEVVDRPSTSTSFVRRLPVREWGFEHCPAVPYWADAHGDPDLKHVLATQVKLNARGQQGISTAYEGLSTDFTISGQTHNAYGFLYGAARPGTGDDPPKGSPPPDELPLGDAREFTLSWTRYQKVYEDSQDLAKPFADTLNDDDDATRAFWPTIANFGLPYNLLVLQKVDPVRAGELEARLGGAWAAESLADAHADGRLYEIDMSLLASVEPTTAIDGSTRFTPGTVTWLTQDRESKRLTPVAIEVSTEGGPLHVYTSRDHAWRYALQAAKASITVWGIWLGHVGHWHVPTAAMHMTMYNHLPPGHRLYPLLQPQSQSLIDFDFILLTHLWGQIAPPTPVADYMQLLRLLDAFAGQDGGRDFLDDDPRAELERRGLDHRDFTVVKEWDAYPLVGYLLDLWEITADYVTAVVHDLYAHDHEVARDPGLQEWMTASRDPNRGNLRLPKVETRGELARVLTSLLYRVTAHGAGSLTPVVNPVLSFVANFPPCLQSSDIPAPDDRSVDDRLLGLLPHTGTIGGMTTFYYTFAYSDPYAPLIPSGGMKADPPFPKGQQACNDALFAYRAAVSAFVDEYVVAWNEALAEIRGAPAAPPSYSRHQIGQWPLSIEI